MVKVGMAAMAAVAFGAVFAASPAFADTSSDQIKALEGRFAAAVSAKDLDGIMKVYAPGDGLFVFDVVPPRQYVGAAAYRKDWAAFLASYKGSIKFSLSDLVVQTDGSVGWGHSIQRVVGVGDNGQASDMTVRVTDVYRRIEGRWLIVQEHVSVPVDLATGKADLASKP
jgi:uncharacterized protein (TIGR02246 family)